MMAPRIPAGMRTLARLLVPAVCALTMAMAIPKGILEAPAGFDDQTNGLVPQTVHDADRELFAKPETLTSGLGPIYNGQSCFECHQAPVAGGVSFISVVRAGHIDPVTGAFVSPAGGSLMHLHAIDPAINIRTPETESIRTRRKATPLLGDGYVEAIDDATLLAIAKNQSEKTRGRIAGQPSMAPILEAGGALRVGRFGWKSQYPSLLSFSADSYFNEEGITNRFFPTENTALGKSVDEYDPVPDPEDDHHGDGFSHLERFVRFIRATKVPPRDEKLAATPEAQAGALLFEQVGCGICHVASLQTAPAGTKINGGQFEIPDALGSRIIHPFSDFLLHDIGTGDGIVQNGDQSTAQKMRTAPLWGLRTRHELMHAGMSATPEEAIARHHGEAESVGEEYRKLSPEERRQLLRFLDSL